MRKMPAQTLGSFFCFSITFLSTVIWFAETIKNRGEPEFRKPTALVKK